jgi:hypothetical protein
MKHRPLHYVAPGLFATIVAAAVLACALLTLSADMRRDALERSLLGAITAHDSTRVDRLLAMGANPNAVATDEPALTWLSLLQRVWNRFRWHEIIRIDRHRKSALALVFQFDMISQSEQPSCDMMAASLLRYGADPDIIDDHGNGPLSKAALRGLHRTLRLLLTHGFDPNKRDINGFPPLACADLPNTLVLLEFSADPNTLAPDGDPPLMLLNTSRSADIARALLRSGADARAISNGGHSAMCRALADLSPGPDRDAVVTMLAERGARLTTEDRTVLADALTPAERNRYMRLVTGEASP